MEPPALTSCGRLAAAVFGIRHVFTERRMSHGCQASGGAHSSGGGVVM